MYLDEGDSLILLETSIRTWWHWREKTYKCGDDEEAGATDESGQTLGERLCS